MIELFFFWKGWDIEWSGRCSVRSLQDQQSRVVCVWGGGGEGTVVDMVQMTDCILFFSFTDKGESP